MPSRAALAALLLLAAAGVLALVAIAWYYSSLLPPGSSLPAGGCGFVVTCGLLLAGFVGTAWWLLSRSDG